MAETEPSAALHLTEHQREAVCAGLRGDNVDLAEPAAPIPLQHLHALPLQLRTRQILPRTPSCCLDSVFGIATSTRKSADADPKRAAPPKPVERTDLRVVERDAESGTAVSPGVGPTPDGRTPAGMSVDSLRCKALIATAGGVLGILRPRLAFISQGRYGLFIPARN